MTVYQNVRGPRDMATANTRAPHAAAGIASGTSRRSRPAMVTDGGQILLILASTGVRTTAQLAAISGLNPAGTLRQLARLVELGFVAVEPPGDVAVYQLNPKGVRTEGAQPHRRILLVEDDAAVREMMTLLLEEEGYVVVVVSAPAEARALLRAVAFDLVITDSFGHTHGTVVTGMTEVLAAAGETPVALFTAHRVELDAASAAGFRDLLTKPSDLDMIERQVRILLTPATPDEIVSGTWETDGGRADLPGLAAVTTELPHGSRRTPPPPDRQERTVAS